jgi:hypothetical protein
MQHRLPNFKEVMETPVRHRIANVTRSVIGFERTRKIGDTLDDAHRFMEYVGSARGRESAQRLRAMHNRFSGKRAFVIGNGPSLKKMDLAPLAHEYTFGSNRIYLAFEELGFLTTFLCGIAKHIISQFGQEMAEAGCQHVFMSHRYAETHNLPRTVTTLLSRARPVFGEDPLFWGFHDAGTVTNAAIQLAYYFGFSEVVLIGVDHHFVTTGPVAGKILPKPPTDARPDTVVSEGDDPNHFTPNYFGPGVTWELPDWVTMERGYARARDHFERHGRRIVDATVGGKLTVFPKVDYEVIIGKSGS